MTQEKMKKKGDYTWVEVDEVVVLIVGLLIFYKIENLVHIFILGVVVWYWIKIRRYETKVLRKKEEIYNVYYDSVISARQEVIDKITERDRKPLNFDLDQLEIQRKFLVDK